MTFELQKHADQSVLVLEDYNRTDLPKSKIKGYVFLGALLVASFVGGIGYWATTSKLDGAVIAPASLVVDGNRKTVEHLEGGIIREILVRDGDLVAAGQPLVELDSTDLNIDLDVIKSQIGDLIARRGRLIAQIENSPSFDRDSVVEVLPAGMRDIDISRAFQTQKLLFEAERRSRTAANDLLRQRVATFEAQLEGLEAQRQSNSRQLEITLRELEDLENLLEKGLVASARVTSRQVEAERLSGVEASLQTTASQARNQISELQLSNLETQTLRAESASTELVSVEAQLATLIPQYTGAIERVKRGVIVAPVSGRIVGLSVFTQGGVIQPGEAILDIVPESQSLVVEARVDTTDVEKLYVGQNSRIRLSGFDQGDVPEALGQIIDISADSFEDPRTGRFYYKAVVSLDEEQPAQIADLSLVPGMPADLFINTGERTALSYLAQPLTERLHRTFIE